MDESRDDQLRRIFDELAERLRAGQADLLGLAAADLAALVEAERRRTVERSQRDHDAAAHRLLDGLRALDSAATLSQALDALLDAARAEGERVALFLVRGDTLHVWGHSGFESMPSTSASDVPLSSAGLLAEAVRAAQPQRAARASAGQRPAFAGDGPDGVLLAVPLTMNGDAIAVLYGETSSASDAARLSTRYEIMARHAARVLEARTALRVAQLDDAGAAAGRVAPGAAASVEM